MQRQWHEMTTRERRMHTQRMVRQRALIATVGEIVTVAIWCAVLAILLPVAFGG